MKKTNKSTEWTMMADEHVPCVAERYIRTSDEAYIIEKRVIITMNGAKWMYLVKHYNEETNEWRYTDLFKSRAKAMKVYGDEQDGWNAPRNLVWVVDNGIFCDSRKSAELTCTCLNYASGKSDARAVIVGYDQFVFQSK